MVLLDVLGKLAKKMSKTLICAHINHGLRGSESDADELFIKNYCAKQNVIFECKRVNTKLEQERKKTGIEAAARDLRYAALSTIAADYQPSAIFVAHNKNDQAETFMLQLIRGAGLKGLGAMQLKSDAIIRPLLTVSRVEIEQYCQQQQLEYRYDSSNSDVKYLRNSVRHKLLPLLANFNPRIVQSLCRTAEIISAEEQCMHEYAEAFELECVQYVGDAAWITKRKISMINIALQRRIVRLVIAKLGYTGNLAFEKVEKIIAQIGGRVASIVEIDGRLRSRNCYDHLELSWQNTASDNPVELFTSSLSIPGSCRLSDTEQLELELVDGKSIEYSIGQRHIYHFEYNQLQLPLFVRARKSGDIVQFDYGSKSVKKLLIEKKVPRDERSRIPLLCDSSKILAVLGVAESTIARTPDLVTKYLKITYIKETKNAR